MKHYNFPMSNITRAKKIDLTLGDFEDANGFFIRSDAGAIKYCPVNNREDADAITKTVADSVIFVDPEMCRKIFATGTTATNIFVGYGV